MVPVRVYLDSSDFSVLSDPRCLTNELEAILKQLHDWVSEGKIVCLFSGTHLSEMAPVEAEYADAARRRADLLVGLCGRNALVSLDVLFAGELRYALKQATHPPVVQSQTGDWFPDGIMDISPVNEIDMRDRVKDAIDDLGLNRKSRRIARRMALKRNGLRKNVQASLVSNARTGELDEIVEKYPMRPQDARVLGRYVVGDATVEEANAAFLESLRDPSWMMQWFAKHHDKLTPLIEWTRKPAASMLNSLNMFSQNINSIRQMEAEFWGSNADEFVSQSKWYAFQNQLLLDIAVLLSKELLDDEADELTIELVDEACPGLSVSIRSLHSAWRASLGRKPRQAKLSDFPDAMHAMYAPYVDVFRADSFMAPYIAQYAKKCGTRVVPKLADLLTNIRVAMAAEPGIARGI